MTAGRRVQPHPESPLRQSGHPNAGLAVIESPATSWLRARALAHAAPRPISAIRLRLNESIGATLAADLRPSTPLPAFDTAAMDGYAVAGSGPFQIRGEIRAGQTWSGSLASGDALAIATGAAVPAGCEAVVPIEQTRTAGLMLFASPIQNAHIRRAGEDAAAGSVLAPAGSPVTPALLGLAAACGHDYLTVTPLPRLQVFITGDELRHEGPSQASGQGAQVRDAIGPMLAALLPRLGGTLSGLSHLGDDGEALPNALASVLTSATLTSATLTSATTKASVPEIIVITGSTSVGNTDRLRGVLNQLQARWIVDTVACKPGHPQLLAELRPGTWLVGLPGNPYAALVAAQTLLAPLLAGLSGRALRPLPSAVVIGQVRPAVDVTRLVPVVWEGDHARVLTDARAASLHGASLCDAIAALPPGWEAGRLAPLLLMG